ncbi:hypothetical protein NJB1808e29_33310 [Mycobacterium marinum]|nr:hypothetical protein NJB1808e29_33310 [Mycobacterium marinum]GJP26753.1 hypothetical protein NJB1808_46020 [Mycobacterium marinum]
MQRDVLPIATQIYRHIDPFQQRVEIAFVPPLIAGGMLDRRREPQLVPRARIVPRAPALLISRLVSWGIEG